MTAPRLLRGLRGATTSAENSAHAISEAVGELVDALMDQEADAFLGLRVAKYRARFGFGEDVMTEQNVASVTASWWPRRRQMPASATTSQRTTLRSFEHETSRSQPALSCSDVTAPLWPVSTTRSEPSPSR